MTKRFTYSVVFLLVIGMFCHQVLVAEEPRTQDRNELRLSLHFVQINVTDVPKARDFYVNVLGCDEVPNERPSKVVELLSGANVKILLYPVQKVVPVDYPNQTGVTLIFAVENIDRTVATLRQRGVEFIPVEWSKDASGVGWSLYGRFIAFRDPFGNVHELIQPPDPS